MQRRTARLMLANKQNHSVVTTMEIRPKLQCYNCQTLLALQKIRYVCRLVVQHAYRETNLTNYHDNSLLEPSHYQRLFTSRFYGNIRHAEMDRNLVYYTNYTLSRGHLIRATACAAVELSAVEMWSINSLTFATFSSNDSLQSIHFVKTFFGVDVGEHTPVDATLTHWHRGYW